MKILKSLLIAFTGVQAAMAAEMVNINDRVQVEVRAQNEAEHKDLAHTSTDTLNETKTLTILLSGRAKNPETRVAKWVAYGRNMKTHQVQVLDRGEIKVSFDDTGKQTADTHGIKFTYTPEHVDTTPKKVNGHTQVQNKRVEASGVRFAGYSVKVMDGAQIVGEAADPENIEHAH